MTSKMKMMNNKMSNNSTNNSRRKLFFRAWIILCMLLNTVSPQDIDNNLSSCEIEALLRQIINPSPEYQMHAASLRNQLRNLLENDSPEGYQTIDNAPSSEFDFSDQDKRSLSSLARNGFLHSSGKRYVGALARAGMLRGPIEEYKRSLATLAKNGQLPSQEPDIDETTSPQWGEEKRNLGSLAKSGYLNGKRNIGSLARDYQLPGAGKRNLASLARLGFVPSTTPKRNMASLARFNSYTNKREANYPKDGVAEKRNIGALKNSPVHGAGGNRQKRDLYSGLEDNLEMPDQYYQPLDYDDLNNNWERLYGPYYGDNIREGKRFLGSVARNGWFQSDSSSSINKRNIGSLARLGLLRSEYSNYGAQKSHDTYRQQEQKRHIGALARSGWLPSFRPVRSGRFSRSGRARSRIVEYYPQQERLRQPIAAVCRRCDETQLSNSLSWGAPGLQSTWGTPPRLTALHWRSLRPTGIYSY